MTYWRVPLLLAALYAVYASIAFAFQRDLIFAGRRRGPAPERPLLPPAAETVWLDVGGVGRVEMLHWPPSPEGGDAPRAALIFAHGNAELIEHLVPLLAAARDLGVTVAAVEYPGYGRSQGTPSQASITRAMAAAYDWLAQRPQVDRARIVAYGRSLGGGAACSLALSRPLAALILQSTFTDLGPFVRGMGLPQLLLRDRFDNRAAVAALPLPVLVLHGDRDDVVPYAHGQALARAAQDATLITYPCRHNDCPPDVEAWRDAMGAFLRARGVL